LAELGFFPVGFRAPEFVTTPDTFRILEICDFLYSSSTLSPPRTFSSLLRRPLTEGVLYPYHPSGYRLLEFTDQVNPLQKFDKGVRIFRRIHSLNGVFVYHTYIGSVSKPENLQILEEFFEIILSENTWCTTLSTLSRWWLAREKLRVESAREGDCLVVTFTNPTPYPLDDIGLWISRSPSGARRYRLQDHNGVALA
ncbi:MAG TPA: hypothetical protein PK636_06055, partial [bacterium]|nr:hypothetical protein [bacterium]